MLKIINACRDYFVNEVFSLGLFCTTKAMLLILVEIHNSLVKLSAAHGFKCIDTFVIFLNLELHLLEEGRTETCIFWGRMQISHQICFSGNEQLCQITKQLGFTNTPLT